MMLSSRDDLFFSRFNFERIEEFDFFHDREAYKQIRSTRDTTRNDLIKFAQ